MRLVMMAVLAPIGTSALAPHTVCAYPNFHLKLEVYVPRDLDQVRLPPRHVIDQIRHRTRPQGCRRLAPEDPLLPDVLPGHPVRLGKVEDRLDQDGPRGPRHR